MLTNVGGGAAPAVVAAAPAAAAAPAGDAPAKKEEKKEGTYTLRAAYAENNGRNGREANSDARREGGVRRGHGLRSVRLSVSLLRLPTSWWKSQDGHSKGISLDHARGYVTHGYASPTLASNTSLLLAPSLLLS